MTILSFLEFNMKGIIWFWCLTSFIQHDVFEVNVVVRISVFSFSLLSCYTLTKGIYHISIVKYVGCFQFRAIITNNAMNIYIQSFMWANVFILFG